ncbi:MAG: hypothetical protein HYS13_16920 [Planctomycetia bacterium]|nr:hypothetical protein [Planctomycetia bacterium]
MTGASYYFATSVIVVVGVLAGSSLLVDTDPGLGTVARLANWDGRWYRRIVDDGYQYDPKLASNVAFFPAYPLLARFLHQATGCKADVALVIVSHLALLGAFMVMACYARTRRASGPPEAVDLTLLAFGLLPTTFFLRMAYSEALFCLVTALALLGMHRHWRPVVVAVIVGLATATRPVGVALVVPLAIYTWRRTRSGWSNWDRSGATRTQRGLRLSLAALSCFGTIGLCCWGLAAFMAFQWFEFGDALAFVKTQSTWRIRHDELAGPFESAWRLLTLEPVWSVYVPSRPDYWMRFDSHENPLFSLQFANPVFFIGAAVLVVIGAVRRQLTDYEVWTAVLLLLIPYVTRSHENAMAGFGRFAAVVIPVYPVMAWLLLRLDTGARCLVFAVAACFLGLYSAMFAASYRLI